MQPVAIHGTLGASPLPLNRGSVTGRAVTDRQEIHVYEEVTDLDMEFPESTTRERQRGLLTRTRLAVPLLLEGAPLGAILIRRVDDSSVLRQADRASQNLRRSGRYRNRERSTIPGTAGCVTARFQRSMT